MPFQHVFPVLRNSRNILKALGSLSIHDRSPALLSIVRCKVTVTAYPTPIAAPPIVRDKTVKVSKAMKAYMERSREHEEFMKAQTTEYEIGKRHLANMMGEDAESFTQDDVDNAVEYLFPSGIYDKKARPLIKPPEVVFPQQKAAQFDETGRPFNSFFYTGSPNFYKILFNIVAKTNELFAYEDGMVKQNVQPDPALNLDLSSSVWITKEELEAKTLESISDKYYISFIEALERLLNSPFSYLIEDFFMNYRKNLKIHNDKYMVAKPKMDEDGRLYVTTYECLRKTSRGHVTIRSPGTGIISVNNQDITFFDSIQSREQLIFPLVFTNLIDKVDIEAHVEGGGFSSKAGAVRWGISMGLRSFVDEQTVEKMRVAGLLQRDWRRKERKKPGQEGARRKFTWKKR